MTWLESWEGSYYGDWYGEIEPEAPGAMRADLRGSATIEAVLTASQQPDEEEPTVTRSGSGGLWRRVELQPLLQPEIKPIIADISAHLQGSSRVDVSIKASAGLTANVAGGSSMVAGISRCKRRKNDDAAAMIWLLAA